MRLDYEAPAACPGRSLVVRAILERTAHFRLATEREAARTLRLRVESLASSFHGALEVIELDGSTMHRDLGGPTCGAVVSALALVAALALDPVAASSAPEAPVATRSTPPDAPAAPVAAAAPESPLPAADAPVAAPVPPSLSTNASQPGPVVPPRARIPEPAPPPLAARLRVGVGVAAEIAGLAAPTVVLAPAGLAEIVLDSPGLFAPLLRLGVARQEGGTVAVSGKDATFTWLLGQAAACPVRVRLIAAVAVRPCLGADVGAVSAVTSGAPQPTNPARLWADMSLEGRVEWRILDRVSLDIEGGLMVPIVRDSFVFEPTGDQAYRAPAATGVGSIGAMVLFW